MYFLFNSIIHNIYIFSFGISQLTTYALHNTLIQEIIIEIAMKGMYGMSFRSLSTTIQENANVTENEAPINTMQA